jgi:hypothetical protein
VFQQQWLLLLLENLVTQSSCSLFSSFPLIAKANSQARLMIVLAARLRVAMRGKVVSLFHASDAKKLKVDY